MSQTATPNTGSRRRLTTVLAADICGYSRLAEVNEAAAVKTVKIVFAVFKKVVASHHGRVFNRSGDGFFAEFPSVTDGVEAALAFTADIKARNTLSPNAPNAKVRAGLHVGDVMEQADGDLLGHGVNIAARLQSEAEPNGVLISLHAVNLVREKIEASFHRRGPLALKNIDAPVVAFDVTKDRSTLLRIPQLLKRVASVNRPSMALILFAIGLLLATQLMLSQPSETEQTSASDAQSARINIVTDGVANRSRQQRDILWLRSILENLATSDRAIDSRIFALLENRDIAAAIRLLKQKYQDESETNTQEENLAILHQLGAIAFETDIDEAKVAYQQVIDLDPESFLAHARLGRLNYYQSRSAESNRHFDRALALDTPYDDERINTLISYATSKIVQERFQEAQEMLDIAAKDAAANGLDSLVSRAQSRIAFAQFQQGEFTQARQTITKVMPLQSRLSFDADRAISLSLLGSIAQAEGKFQEALSYYQQAYNIEQGMGRVLGIADSLFYVGLMGLKTGDVVSAEKKFNEGLNLARANNLVNMQIKNYIGKALVYKSKGDQHMACTTLDRAVDLHTSDIVYIASTKEMISELGCPFPPLTFSKSPT